MDNRIGDVQALLRDIGGDENSYERIRQPLVGSRLSFDQYGQENHVLQPLRSTPEAAQLWPSTYESVFTDRALPYDPQVSASNGLDDYGAWSTAAIDLANLFQIELCWQNQHIVTSSKNRTS